MIIRYTEWASVKKRQIRRRSEALYHSLQGLIIQIAANPEIDNERKILRVSRSGRTVPAYVDEEWEIYYSVKQEGGEEVFSVISVWEAESPPQYSL